jgi:hypothetical protein
MNRLQLLIELNENYKLSLLSEEEQLTSVTEDGTAIQYINNPSLEVQLKANTDELLLNHLSDDELLQLKLLRA